MAIRLAGVPDLAGIVRAGDAIIWGQGCGEPTTLVEALVDQRAALGGVSAFIGSSFSSTLAPEHADHIAFSSMGAIGTLAPLARAGVLGIIPTHVGQVYRLIEQGLIGCDVAMVQVSPADADGRHSYGLINDYIQTVVARSRVVIAEVNDQVPWTHGDATLEAARIDYLLETSRPPIELRTGPTSVTDQEIARHVSAFIEDGCVLQMGIGAVPEAITRLLGDRRDLGVHSGMIGDGIAELMRRGVVTNARKTFDTGVTIAGALIGSRSLYDFADRNPAIGMHNSAATHGEAALSAIPGLVTINSAIEVDLTGQVNAEQTGSAYLGGTGGQVDYVRAGMRSSGGRSIIALPATAKGGKLSRIVGALSGPVTTARSEADIVVTEHGAAELRGQTLAERARRMIAIAAPEFRAALDRDAHDLLRRGY